MFGRKLKKLGFVLGLLSLAGIVLILGLITWVAKTESGLRWAFKQAPTIISIHEVNGDLSDFSFKNLILNIADNRIEIGSGQITWRLFDLLSKQLSVQNLRLNKVGVQLPVADIGSDGTEYVPWKGLQLPINVVVNKLQVNNFELSQNSEQLLKLDRLTIGLSIHDSLLTLASLELKQAENKLDLGGRLDLSAQTNGLIDLSNSLQWNLGQEPIQAEGTVKGTWRSFELNQISSSQWFSDLNIAVNNVLGSTISWQGTVQTKENKFSANDQQQLNVGQGNFDVSGAFSPNAGLAGLVADISGSISGNNEQFSSWNLVTDLNFANDTLSVRRFALSEETQHTQKLSQAQQPLPTKSVKSKVLEPGLLNVFGSIVGVSDFIEGENTGSAKADLQGDWKALGWPLNQATKQISSSGNFTVSGTPQNFSLEADASGESQGKPLQATTKIAVVDRLVNIEAFKLNSGDSAVDVVGSIGDTLALKWDISSPDLADLIPVISGDLNSQGSLNGSTSAPIFVASAESTRIEYAGFVFSGFSLNANGSASSTLDKIDLSLELAKINKDTQEFAKDIDLSLNGTGKAHTLSMQSVLLDQSSIEVSANGGFIDQGWLGMLDRLEIDHPSYDKWILKSPTKIERKLGALSTERICLTNKNQEVCANIATDDIGLKADADIQNLELDNFNPLLSLYDLTIGGNLNGNFSYDKRASKENALIDATLNSSNAIVAFKRSKTETETLLIESATIELTQQETLAAKALILLENKDQVSANIQIDAAIESPDFADAALQGEILVTIQDLSSLQMVSKQIDSLNGSLNSDISLGGSLTAPSVGMQTQLQNGQFQISELGLDLTDINLDALSKDKQRIDVSGSLVSGQGKLDIVGNLNFAQLNEPTFSLSLTGDQLTLMKTPEVHIDGNVDTSIVITSSLIDLNGEVRLVKADIDFQLPENAILASEDVILLGEEKEQSGSQIRMNLLLELGDKTHIRAQGLDASLVGQLQLLQDPGGILRGNGQIDVKNGKYAAYNQKLEIDKGQLIFNGSAVDDPTLLLRAQKKIDSTTAGVSVTGTASLPQVALYSNPSMSDQDILSFLIFGKRLGDIGSQDGLTLLRIANSLRGDGTSKSQLDVVTQNIQDTFGLSNLELQLNGNSPSVVAGKQFSSRFYVGYGYGLLDAAQSLILRYKISNAWSIQGDVGADSGADLRYQIER